MNNNNKFFINGKWVKPSSNETLSVINPATEEVICEVHEALAPDVDAAVAAAKAAFDLGAPWREADASFRRNCIFKLADLIERDRVRLGLLESLDNGKPTGADGTVYGSAVDLHLMIDCFKYYAGHADKVQGRTIPIDGNFLCPSRIVFTFITQYCIFLKLFVKPMRIYCHHALGKQVTPFMSLLELSARLFHGIFRC